ncbi:MAG TPA: hypothetical protein VLA13_04420, partial [Massilibacterium sp.]|nr:hypothetical protein [Massilibacterium sp.]
MRSDYQIMDKSYIQNIAAIVTVLMLVGGFQLNSTDYSKSGTDYFSLDKAFGIEEAYAGPCGDAGCDGKPGFCGSVTVVKVLKWSVTKD